MKKPLVIILLGASAIALLIGAQPRDTFAWSIAADFESGPVGAAAQGESGFHEAWSLTTFTNEIAHSGSKAVKLVWQGGSTGYDQDGGRFFYPQPIPVGGELWTIGYYYLGSPWSWKAATTNNCGCEIKTFRANSRDAGGNHRGYIGVATNDNGYPFLLCETCNGLQALAVRQGDVVLQPGRWYALEVYVKFHPTDGVVRLWIDGQLKAERTGVDTAHASSDAMDFSQFLGYWNGGCAQSQVMYLDDLFLTTDMPANRDTAGHPMIGARSGGGGTAGAPPAPPSNVRIVN